MALSTQQQQITGTLAQTYPAGQELAKVTDLGRPYPAGHELAVVRL
jgi:hypothetical protein